MVRTTAVFFYVHTGLDDFNFKVFADINDINIVGYCIELNGCKYLADLALTATVCDSDLWLFPGRVMSCTSPR